MKACFRGPARTAVEAAITAGVGAYRIADPVDAATVAAAKVWLQARYHTPEIQQELKDQLQVTVQEPGESPLTFYTRITDIVDNAGYGDGEKAQATDNAFMNGIQPNITLQIRSTPNALDLDTKVRFAQRYWSA